MQEIRIIASIIQKESNNISEMPAISSVIQNRLKTNMRLQMDSTLNYGKYSHTFSNSATR
ncbi:MAG: endolytic transglycosylase MltG [Campylobacterales bacterium]|nr:endolytic transglycosylase MltG [Campylobacterales bacterium]